MKDPVVTVIIPNYNHAPFLRRRLESVLGQTYPHFEVLLLDDASTDDSRRVIAEFDGDPRIRTFLNDTNTGVPGKQWNRGVREARGEYVWIAESDDYADPQFLERLVPFLDAHPSAGLVYCQSWVVDAEDRIVESYDYYTEDLDPARWKQNFFNNGKDECNNYLFFKNTIPNASAVLFRKSVYEEAGYADEWVRYCGDWLLWVKMLMISDVVFVAHPLNYYRWHESALSHGPRAKGAVGPSPLTEAAPALQEMTTLAFEDEFRRWPAKLAYIMGRNALRANRPEEARRYFKQSLELHASFSTLLFWASSYLGRPLYQNLDGIKSRVPVVGRLAGKINRVLLSANRLLTRRRYPRDDES